MPQCRKLRRAGVEQGGPMGSWVIGFLGYAALCAAGTGLAVLAGLHLGGRRPVLPLAPVVFSTALFVFMTQVPFPAPGQLTCPVPSATPQLAPFYFWRFFADLAAQRAGWQVWLGSRAIMATVMNFGLCALIGLSLALVVRRFWVAGLFGAGLTGTVELTQLTGIWGIYPCAYRQFNVDDLMLNLAGVLAGFALGAAWRRWGRAPRRDPV